MKYDLTNYMTNYKPKSMKAKATGKILSISKVISNIPRQITKKRKETFTNERLLLSSILKK